MGKQSTRENKTIYQICREEAGLTRLEASEKMTAVSDYLEKIQNHIIFDLTACSVNVGCSHKFPSDCFSNLWLKSIFY